MWHSTDFESWATTRNSPPARPSERQSRFYRRALALRLRELETAHLIERTVIPSMPVQIRYALTPVGVELVTALQPLVDFALRHVVEPTAAPRSGG